MQPSMPSKRSVRQDVLPYDKVERIVASLQSDIDVRKRCLEVFAEAIIEVNKYGANKWGAYVNHTSHDRIRLLVGNLIVLTVHKNGLWMALDRQSLEESQEQREYVEQSPGWEWDIGLSPGSYPEYKVVPSKNGYYTPSNDLHLWTRLKELHFALIRRTAKKYEQLNVRSQARHMPELLAYLRRELQQHLPDPVYGDESVYLPEEIPDRADFFEGTKLTRTVNAYERNHNARQACITHYGTSCVVCGFSFSEMYGEAIAKDFIHVHHVKPLAGIGEEYKVDPINDLRPVCPNCHAIIHKSNPPYSIDEVKRFLRDAQTPS